MNGAQLVPARRTHSRLLTGPSARVSQHAILPLHPLGRTAPPTPEVISLFAGSRLEYKSIIINNLISLTRLPGSYFNHRFSFVFARFTGRITSLAAPYN